MPLDAARDDEADVRDDASARAPRGRFRWRAVLGLTILAVVAAALVATPWWVPRALGKLAFFRVRRIEIDGARYAPPAELLARLRVDTTVSVFTNLDALGRRVGAHPLVAEAHVERRLPNTLRVVITEKAPVALAPSRSGLAVVDADGRALPIDPSRVGGIDVPIVASADTALLHVLSALRSDEPALYARVSEARRVAPDELRFAVVPGAGDTPGQEQIVLRTAADVTPERMTDMLTVEGDLARRRVKVAEIDLRYREQVIARLP